MSNWTTRLPYAHRYITKTWFEGAEADLDLPDKKVFTERAYTRRLTGANLKRLRSYYYELQICRWVDGSEEFEGLAIGYTANFDEILYGNDGRVSTRVSNDQSRFVGTPYGAGDIIGCGYEFPSRFFFTKNGIYLGDHIAQLRLNTLRPEVRTWADSPEYYEPINVGQQPFIFDIEGHFSTSHARSLEIATNLPLEILEEILQHSFVVSQDTNHLPHLSRVCRRWRTLFSRSVIDLSIFTRSNLEDVLGILRTATSIRAPNVITQESFGDAWLHRFLMSPLLHIHSTSKLVIQTPTRHQGFLEKAPPILSQCVPGILRSTFTEVHTLELSNYSFATWTRFAQVVFAFQRLETFVCSGVTWETSPATPPTWLTFSKRLRRATFEDMGDKCIAGLFWLFLAGRPRQPSDDLVLIPSDVSIIGQLATLILRPHFIIVYDQGQGQPRSCTLSAPSYLYFYFVKNGATYQLTHIYARLLCKVEMASNEPDDSTIPEIGRCSAALSSAESCRFCYELSELKRGEGPFLRRKIAKAMMWQHTAGLLECTWTGETIEDTQGVRWLDTDAVIAFGVKKTYKRETSGQVTWDVDALHPHFRVETIPWLKLYKHADQITGGQFIADVAFDIKCLDGQAEFLLPEVDPGLYFLAVGDYIYCTETFQVIA